MRPIIFISIALLCSSVGHTYDSPDKTAQMDASRTLEGLFGLDPNFKTVEKDPLHRDKDRNEFDTRIQRWVGSTEPSSSRGDCEMIVYAVKARPEGASERPSHHHLIDVLVKVKGSPPARAGINVQSHVRSLNQDNGRTVLKKFEYQREFSRTSGGSPEGRMAMAMLTVPAQELWHTLTFGVFHSKDSSTLEVVAGNGKNSIQEVVASSIGVNDEPKERSTKCFGMKLQSYEPAGWDKARGAIAQFESVGKSRPASPADYIEEPQKGHNQSAE